MQHFHGRRVLIIEDDEDGAITLSDLLGLFGHETHVARDGPEGLLEAHRLRPDVILCDLGLPQLDGYEVARHVSASPDLQGTILIALSGHAMAEDVARARAAGFHHHLAKPPDPNELLRLVGESRENPESRPT